MFLEQFKLSFSSYQNKTLSGGIIGKHLRIIDNGSGQLTLTGDISITRHSESLIFPDHIN